jgi:hypothetical protein
MAVLSIFGGSSQGQKTAPQWRGVLQDDSGLRIGNARVDLTANRRDQTAVTNADGSFSFTTLQPNTYELAMVVAADPLLAGTVVGNLMKCEQGEHVIGDIKHYVMNDQETGRNIVNAIRDRPAVRHDLGDAGPSVRRSRGGSMEPSVRRPK